MPKDSFVPDSFVPDEPVTSGPQTVSGQDMGKWPRMATVREIASKPGLLPAVGGLALGMATPGLGLLRAAGAVGLGMSGGEGYRQIAAGGEKTVGESLSKIGEQQALGVGSTLLLGAGGQAFSGIRSYVANSPRILNALAKTVGSLTNKTLNPKTILEAIQRIGVAEKMPGIEKTVADIKYAPSTSKIANLAESELAQTQKQGGVTLLRLQNRLKNQRLLMGKEIEKADNQLIDIAQKKADSYVDLTDIGDNIYKEYYLPVIDNPVLKDLPGIKALGNKLAEIGANPVISIADAIKAKKLIAKVYEDFSKKGVMNIQDIDTLNLAMKQIRKGLDGKIKEKAVSLGYSDYAKTYKRFGKYADDYDSELMPILGSGENRMAVENRINKLAGQVNAGDLRLEIIKDVKKFVPKDSHTKVTEKTMDDLTDYLVLNSIYKDMGSAPSSFTVGLSRLALEPVTKSLVKIRNAKPYIPTVAKTVTPAIEGITSVLSPNEK
jgi:hypothetical protein